MENVIKLPASQALFNANNRLVDLVIPGNSGVYNLSETYVAIDMSVSGLEFDLTQAADGRLTSGAYVQAADAVGDVRVALKHNATTATIYDRCAMPVETLVRNCSMFTASRGKIEDIRRADTLRATMKAYTQDIEDVEDASIGGLAPMAKSNPWGSGRFAHMVGVGDVPSEYKNHELRIMLKDLFNVAEATEWDSSVYGDTRIHLELNLNRVELQQPMLIGVWDRYYHNQVGGTPSYPVDVKYSKALQLEFAVAATAVSQDDIIMEAEYQSLDDSPFFVHQMLKVETNYTQTAGGTTGAVTPADASVTWAVVKTISWDRVTKRITLGFGAGAAVLTIAGPVATHPLFVDRTISAMPLTATSLATALSYESVELTAVRQPDVMEGPAQTQYTQFITQSDQWQNSESLNRSYYLPPQTMNAFIVMPSSSNAGGAPTGFSDILGCARLKEYRFSLNGESVTNRAVPYMPVPVATANNDGKCDRGSSLHYTLISEAMMNAGIRYHSLEESVYDQDIPLSTNRPVDAAGNVGWQTLAECPTKACYMLALPVPISNNQTMLTIELEGNFPASSGEIHIFSQVRSVA